MIVNAKSKAQGVKRVGCNMSQNDSLYTNLSPDRFCALNIYLNLIIELLMRFYRCSLGLFLKFSNRISNVNIYFLQIRVILKETLVSLTLVFLKLII